ncbi:MAG TPA: YlbF family regulator [Pseudobacteroides sp.]|uniref:YlbF family regulator n=1 Tax=Pseudobacteroides sp. TaxID=1968840 RepID=UPI002F9254DF
MGLNNHIWGLVEAIKASSEFSKLKQANDIISKNPVLKKELEDLNARQEQLLTSRLSAKEAESNLKQLNSKIESLSNLPEVDSYFKAAHAFERMMYNIYKEISGYLEKELKK